MNTVGNRGSSFGKSQGMTKSLLPLLLLLLLLLSGGLPRPEKDDWAVEASGLVGDGRWEMEYDEELEKSLEGILGSALRGQT